MKNNPTPALPLSGEGAKSKNTLMPSNASLSEEVAKDKDTIKTAKYKIAPPLAPPPDKGEVGRGLSNKTKFHNLKPQINKRRENRKNPTEPEKRFWSWVRGKQLGCKFRRQHGMGQYIVDFYCAEHALIVELDGESHFTAEGVNSDKVRTAFLESKGFRVLRFSNLDIMQNKEGVLIRLLAYLKTESNPTPTLPLSGEGVRDNAALLAPPSDKGEVGRGLKTIKVNDND